MNRFNLKLLLKELKSNNLYKPQYVVRIFHEYYFLKRYKEFLDFIDSSLEEIEIAKVKSPNLYARGVANNSLLLYVLGFTRIDPIKHKLSFALFKGFLKTKKRIISYSSTFRGSYCKNGYSLEFYNDKTLLGIGSRIVNYQKDVSDSETNNVALMWAVNRNLLIKGKHICTLDDAFKYNVDDALQTKLKVRGYLLSKGQAICSFLVANKLTEVCN